MMKAIIIDDERNAITTLQDMLDQFTEINVIKTFTNPMDAVSEMTSLKPDVIFLDIEMKPYDGLEMAQLYLNEIDDVEIVFVTAYSEYAIQAFEINAVDYLLKPVSNRRLKKSITRLIQQHNINKTINHRIHIQSFGEFFLFDESNTPIKWRTKKAKELFVFLWLQQGQLISKDILVETLYPDRPYSNAQTLFYTLIYQLRKNLSNIGIEDAILLQNGSYMLNGNYDSDLDVLTQILSKHTHDRSDIIKIMKTHTAPLLDVEHYEWNISQQIKVADQVREVLESYLESVHKNGIVDPIVTDIIEYLFKVDPYNEAVFLMGKHYYDQTRQTDLYYALVKRYTATLREDLGITSI